MEGYGNICILHSANQAKVQMASAEPVDANVDLFTAGTVRGEGDTTNALNEVSLPAAVVKISVTLPDSVSPVVMKCLYRETNPVAMSSRPK